MERNFYAGRWQGLPVLPLAILAWALTLAAGFGLLTREQFTPVASTQPSNSFPAGSGLQLTSSRPSLILFLHPHCPCSRATLRELDQVLGSLHQPVDVTIVFTLPPGVPRGWEQGDLWQMATAITGARVLLDQDGREARRFHVVGSGHTLLFLPSGELLFSGGITGSRGHEGDNPGAEAIVDRLNYGHSAVAKTPVFGCALL